MKTPNFIKKIYRYSHWHIYNILTMYKAGNIISIDPKDLLYGFKGDFSPFYTLRLIKSGDWDTAVIPIEKHIVFQSMKDRFVNGKDWTDTAHYKLALKKVKEGKASIKTQHELNEGFREWDDLYNEIVNNGYKSNHQLYTEGKTDNILCLLDEITVNITRDGVYLLNSGWHRTIISKLLNIPVIKVRILVTHKLYKNHK